MREKLRPYLEKFGIDAEAAVSIIDGELAVEIPILKKTESMTRTEPMNKAYYSDGRLSRGVVLELADLNIDYDEFIIDSSSSSNTGETSSESSELETSEEGETDQESEQTTETPPVTEQSQEEERQPLEFDENGQPVWGDMANEEIIDRMRSELNMTDEEIVTHIELMKSAGQAAVEEHKQNEPTFNPTVNLAEIESRKPVQGLNLRQYLQDKKDWENELREARMKMKGEREAYEEVFPDTKRTCWSMRQNSVLQRRISNLWRIPCL